MTQLRTVRMSFLRVLQINITDWSYSCLIRVQILFGATVLQCYMPTFCVDCIGDSVLTFVSDMFSPALESKHFSGMSTAVGLVALDGKIKKIVLHLT